MPKKLEKCILPRIAFNFDCDSPSLWVGNSFKNSKALQIDITQAYSITY